MNSDRPDNMTGTFLCCSLAGLIPEATKAVLSQISGPVLRQFNAPADAAPLIFSIGQISFAAVVLPVGIFGDRFGRKKMLMIGCLLSLLASCTAFFSSSIRMFAVSRALDGISGAFLTTSALALLSIHVHSQLRSRWIGYYLGVISAGSLLFPYLAGSILQGHDWKTTVASVIVLPAVAGIFIRAFIKPDETIRNDASDWRGVFLCSISFLLIVFAAIRSNHSGVQNPLVLILLTGGLCFGGLFVYWESRSAAPVINMSLFKERSFRIAVLAGVILSFVGAGLSVPLLYYFRIVRGSTPSLAALQVMPIALTATLLSPIAGILASKASARTVMAGGAFLMAIGSLAFSGIRADSPLPFLVLAMLIIGAGSAFATTQRTTVILSAAHPDESGAASAITSASSKLGSALGTAMMTTYFVSLAKSEYVLRMKGSGLPLEELQKVTNDWRRAAERIAGAELPPVDPGLLQQIQSAFIQAYSVALARSEFVAFVLFSAAAILIWTGLKPQTKN